MEAGSASEVLPQERPKTVRRLHAHRSEDGLPPQRDHPAMGSHRKLQREFPSAQIPRVKVVEGILATCEELRPKNSDPLSLQIETRDLAVGMTVARHQKKASDLQPYAALEGLYSGSLQPLVLEISSFLHDADCQHVISKAGRNSLGCRYKIGRIKPFTSG